jgi:hypothetical protein
LCADLTHQDRRFVVVFSPVRCFRDRYRHLALCARIEDGLIAIEERVRAGKLADPANTGAAADRVLSSSPVGCCFAVTIRKGFLSWDFDQEARRYDEGHLCGRFVITASLTTSQASAAQALRYYEPAVSRTSLQGDGGLLVAAADVQLDQGPGARTRGTLRAGGHHRGRHGTSPRDAKLADPVLALQSMTPRRAVSVLKEVRLQHISAHDKQIKLVNRQCPPGQGAPGPCRRHLNLVRGRNRLSWANRPRVGGTRIVRDPIYLGRQETRAKLRPAKQKVFQSGTLGPTHGHESSATSR